MWWSLTCPLGLSISLLDSLTRLYVQARVVCFAGNLADVVMGKDTLAEYFVRSAEESMLNFLLFF